MSSKTDIRHCGFFTPYSERRENSGPRATIKLFIFFREVLL